MSQAQIDARESVEPLLDYLKRTRGLDLTGYKRAGLLRRLQKRLQMISVPTLTDYIDYLEVHTEEFSALFDTILINVTSFFRDAPAWSYLAQEIIPRILAAKSHEEPIRAWSAGCASGEEAYSLAMLLAEALGGEAYHRRVKIYATDLDENALASARAANYSPKDVQGVPAELHDKYLERAGGRWIVRTDLRRSVIFGQHDLLQDAPISRLDLLLCRNTLMYFNAEAQARILSRFHFALRDSGYLFMGKVELLLTHADLFSPLDARQHIFVKANGVAARERVLPLAIGGEEGIATRFARQARLRDATFEIAPVAQIVTDAEGNLVLANQRARTLFALSAADVGRPFRDLEISYRPAELRSVIEKAYAGRAPITLTDIECIAPGEKEKVYLDIQITPLQTNSVGTLGVSISFQEVTHSRKLKDELQRSKQSLETAYEELQSSNEELETTNEELQSSVEELETTNEEIQSTNEEMETMNEELQSTNEELQAINDELQQRTTDLNRANAFLESVLSNLRVAVIALNRDFSVLMWNARAENLWGLRADETQGQSLFNLDIGLPVEQLVAPLRAFLSSEASHKELTLPARNRRGKAIVCQLTFTPLLDAEQKRQGVIILLEEVTP
jgi:two-component system CheB/CheR fusion protein